MVEHNEEFVDWSDEEPQEHNEKQGVILEMIPSIDIGPEGGETDINVKITVPEHTAAKRKPVDICCCIDVSGSMQLLAEYTDPETDQMKDDGLSYLDIVKHATKAVMHQMDEGDRMALVTYSSAAEQIFPLTFMSEGLRNGRVAQLEALDV